MTSTYSALLIGIGTAKSNALTKQDLRLLRSLVLYAPATLDAHTFTVEVSAVDGASAVDADYVTLTREGDGANVAIAAGKATVIGNAGYLGLRIKDTTGNVAADRTFKIVGQEVQS